MLRHMPETEPPPAPRPAATVIMLRDAAPGPEVLMLRRHARSGFAADAWVFPGGVVDAGDRELDRARWRGIDPAALSPRFTEPADLVLGFHVAAVRETFEECGLLLATHGDGRAPDVTRPEYVAMRERLGDRDQVADWGGWLAEEELVLDLDALTYFSRWVTPRMEGRRFDAAFFIASAPDGQFAAHDEMEVTGQRWTTAGAALDAFHAGELHLIYPTIRTLEALADFDSAEAAFAHASQQQEIRSVLPHIEVDDDGWRILHPDDPGYPHELYAEGSR
jgi:8-oxo-dGTP pyrophosphatase MutT (NUDIX family)